MARTCPGCGYGPIGPFTDNCPICAAPVRNVRDNDYLGAQGWPPLLVGGWIVGGLVLAYFFWEDWPWLLLSAAVVGTAWWAVAKEETTRLQRLLGIGLVALFVPAIWLAAQPTILPGIDQRPAAERLAERAYEQVPPQIREMMNLPSPNTTRTAARMKTITAFLYPAYALVALPLALIVPPFLNWRQQRQLGGPIWLSKPQAISGLVVWLVVLPLLGWLSWPTLRTWADTPPDALHAQFPLGWPPNLPPDPNEPD